MPKCFHEVITGDGCLESLTRREEIQIAKMALEANFGDIVSIIVSILDPQASCEGTDLERKVIESLKADPSKILDMPILPKSETDSDLIKDKERMDWI